MKLGIAICGAVSCKSVYLHKNSLKVDKYWG